MMMEYLQAGLLGIVEAVTEFLPVSSTGHLILVGKLIGFDGPPGRVFEVAIQLGAILAVCVLYFKRLFGVLTGLGHDPAARHFAVVTIIAFLPAVFVGFFMHDYIKAVLYSPYIVCTALILGGIAILAIEKLRPEPVVREIEGMPYKKALYIGIAQCLALVPGVSRSGATIMGALACGVERRTAAEFSFFQAIPLMFGAVAYDMWQNRATLDVQGLSVVGVGFVVTFIVSLFVVRWMLSFVTRHGFAPFAYYRIVAGGVGLLVLWTI